MLKQDKQEQTFLRDHCNGREGIANQGILAQAAA
jgi:hypothetical protein